MRAFLRYHLVIGFISLMVLADANAQTSTNTNSITREDVQRAQGMYDLDFSDAKIDLMLPSLKGQLGDYKAIHNFALSNSVPSAMLFNPIPVGAKFETERRAIRLDPPRNVKLPANPDELAFYSIEQLAALIKSRQITSEKLTRFYLERLKKYGPKLECVITLTEDLALEQARRADREIAAGKYRGPLQGIPYGVKDLLATRNYKSTWGSAPYQDQTIDEDATVVKRLEAAGAVL